VKKKARITSKGQITVPHEIRRAMGVRPGDSLVFEQKGSEFRVRPARTVSPFEKFRGIGNPGIPSGRKGIIRFVRKLRGR
jgi:antitoxin PrlF